MKSKNTAIAFVVLMAALFISQSTLLCESLYKNTIIRLFLSDDGLFDGDEISKFLHTISL